MGKRPSRIRDLVTLEVPRPRNLGDPACRRSVHIEFDVTRVKLDG